MDEIVSLTEQLRRFSKGDQDIAEAVFRAVYPKLRDIASRSLKPHERRTGLISTGDLVHEVWLAHLRKGGFEVKDQGHFYSIASRAMRQVLVDLARRRLTRRRGDGEVPTSLSGTAVQFADGTASPETVVAMGLLLEKLEHSKPEAVKVFDMHAVAGLTFEEIAEATGLKVRQVRYLWTKAQNWLKDHL